MENDMADLENLTAEDLTPEEIKKLQEVLATAEKKKMEESRNEKLEEVRSLNIRPMLLLQFLIN